MLWRFLISLCLALAFVFSVGAGALLFDRGYAAVIDGDSFFLDGREIRLWGIDAFEYDQVCSRGGRTYACGQMAENYLRRLIHLKKVRCWTKDTHNGRSVARCERGGVDISAQMVSTGWALASRIVPKYAQQENIARARGSGAWAGGFIAPWDYRETRR